MTSTRSADTSQNARPRFLLVGGKGGVGKTTCAAAMALTAAHRGQRTLVVTTDPAPSLGDALGQPLSSRPRQVPLGKGLVLHAVELDAPRAFERWLSARRATLEQIATRGTLLDEADVAGVLRLSLPGIDEVAALFEILALARATRFDLVIVDTAPTGHTLRLLSLPALLSRLADVFGAMQARHRAVVSALRGSWTPDAADALIAGLQQDAADAGHLLRDPARTRVHWVTLPEPLAVEETLDALATIRLPPGLPLERVIVNRMTLAPPSPCPRCSARRAFEARAIERLRSAGVRLVSVASRTAEPRGVTRLRALGRELDAAFTPAPARPVPVWRPSARAAGAVLIDNLVQPTTRVLMFGGKGGVGKTTCAAAAALALARRTPGREVLLVSSDPAHSLADVLEVPLGGTPTGVRGAPHNLRAWEVDAAAQYRGLRDRYAATIEELFSRVTGRTGDMDVDRYVLGRLIELAPPGIDELIAITDIAEQVERGPGDRLLVMDLAPTGHALRLLGTPTLVQGWARALMSLLLKYRAVAGVGDLGAMLLELSKSLGSLRALLTDSTRCSFIPVTRGAALPRAETARLLEKLHGMRMGVPAVIVNATGRGRCSRCTREAAAERREIRTLSRVRLVAGVPLLIAPEEVPAPRRAGALLRWAGTWRQWPP